ncbi:hypothetical protein F5144DRAFT_176135 [Chaetomium tenue]|uniref:Uncharacterized protein n=1 Tax=Chaetomium tenue TaxID=1854479 RepID=A0ACB7PAX7_9PEZI|nr:hypothetical protein F5144DRAFT_176135 [Chaetomium globosum]
MDTVGRSCLLLSLLLNHLHSICLRSGIHAPTQYALVLLRRWDAGRCRKWVRCAFDGPLLRQGDLLCIPEPSTANRAANSVIWGEDFVSDDYEIPLMMSMDRRLNKSLSDNRAIETIIQSMCLPRHIHTYLGSMNLSLATGT